MFAVVLVLVVVGIHIDDQYVVELALNRLLNHVCPRGRERLDRNLTVLRLGHMPPDRLQGLAHPAANSVMRILDECSVLNSCCDPADLTNSVVSSGTG